MYFSPGGDAVTHERSTTDCKRYHWMLSGDAEVCAVHTGRWWKAMRMLQKRISNAADESSQRKIPIDCIVQVEEHRDGCTGTTKSNALGPVICSTTWNGIVVAQAAHRLLFATHCGWQ